MMGIEKSAVRVQNTLEPAAKAGGSRLARFISAVLSSAPTVSEMEAVAQLAQNLPRIVPVKPAEGNAVVE